MVDIQKALGTTQAGTILVDNAVDKIVQHMVDYKNPLRMNLPRKPGAGSAWIVNRRTAGNTAATFVADTDDATEDTGTYAQTSFTYRTILARGKVTRKMQAIGQSYADVLATEMEAKATDFRDFEDYSYIRGDNNADPKAFDGLHILIPASQTVAMTTVAGGAPLTLRAMDSLIDLNTGNPDMLIMNRRTRRELVGLLQAQQRFVNMLEVNGGFKLPSYNEIPVYTSTNVPITQTFNGTTVTAHTGGTTSTVYCIDSAHCFVAELTPLTVMPLAKTSSQFDEFDIFCDEVLVLDNTLKASKLIGISPQ